MLVNLKRNFLLILISVLYFVYGLKLIFLSSYLIGNTKYFSLVDDQMISMRYAKNLANGYGLIWNPGGEHVEGITNFLWAIYMALLHLLPLPGNYSSFTVQLSCLLILTANLFVVYKIAGYVEPKSRFVGLTAVIFTALYFPLNVWGVLYGSEVSILTLCISTAVLLGIQSIKVQKLSLLLPLLLGTMTLIRIDIVWIALVILLFVTLTINKNRQKNILVGGSIFATFLATQTLGRLWYYHDLLPNTYYLKVEGFPLVLRLIKGLYTQIYFIKGLYFVLYLIPFAIVLMKKNISAYFLLTVFIGQQLYSVYVGGDIFDDSGLSFRYIYPVMPLFFLLYTYVVYKVFVSCSVFVARKKGFTKIMAILFIISTLLACNTYNPEMFNVWRLSQQPSMVGGNKINTERALQIDRITTKQATVAVIWAGTTPYFSSRTYIDLYGKNDKTVAHGQMQVFPQREGFLENALAFIPGHMKWNYAYSIGILKPDIITMINPYEHAKKYLEKAYIKKQYKNFALYLRKDSRRLLKK